jgi:aspartate carbamoyltransferase catalytic subunit
MYTIFGEKGHLDGLNFLLVGDMRMRTMHSMSYAMAQFDIEAAYISPPDMSLTEEFKQELDQLNLRYREVEHIEQAIGDADVIYMEPVVQPDYTKGRDEREGDVGLTPSNYQVTKELMRKAKSDAIILHSLPRMDELLEEVDYTRHARYWVEAFNGVVTRMGLLALILGAME